MPLRLHLHSLLTAAACSLALSAGANEPLAIIEPAQDINEAKAELGKLLYFDPRLSKSGFISCNSCHNLSMGGTDNIPTSIGHDWQQGPINSPTVLNSSYSLAQFWDGRAANLQEQAAGPIANPGEMASNHDLAVQVVASIPGYAAPFKQAFGDEKVDIDRITDAIAEFEKTLVTPNAPFDQWLNGDKAALGKDAQAGYKLFKNSGCVACHNGPAVGSTSYQKVGVIKPYKTDNSAVGRAGVTGKDSDHMHFKVPTLRNIELTYPYFHDGAVNSLSEAVDIMGEIQLGKQYSEQENAQIVAFLKSLTGDQPNFPLPILPPSVEGTPRPEPF